MRRFTLAATSGVATILAGLTAQPVLAQNAAAGVEELVVTGSRTRPRSALETIFPVDFLSRQDIEDSLQAETGRAIQSLAPSFNFQSTGISDGTDALRPATLRGLGPDQTLVLVDGTRRHKSALLHVNGTIGRGTAGTDMNAISPSFIGSIEVLRDGASAIYGSDAIAGVFNVGIRKTSPGEVFVSSGETTEGDGETVTFGVNKGFSFGRSGYLFTGYEYRDRGKTNRSGLNGNLFYTAPAGTTTDACRDSGTEPACDAKELTANRRNMIIGDAANEHHSLALNTGMTTMGGTDLRATLLWSSRENQSTGYFREPDNSRNTLAIYPDGFLPEINTDIEDISLVLATNFALGGWESEVALTNGGNTFDYKITNSLNASYGANSPKEADSGGLEYGETTINFHTARELMGGTQLAAGLEAKRESYKIRAGEPLSWANCNQIEREIAAGRDASHPAGLSASDCVTGKVGGIQVFPGFQPSSVIDRDRDSTAVYAELARDLGSRTNVNAALRWEEYDGFDAVLGGRLGALHNLSEASRIRASYSSGYRAPSMQQLYFNTVSTLFNDANEAVQSGTFANDSAVAKALGVPTLDAETATQFGIGYVYAPRDSYSMTLDVFKIDIEDRIILSGEVDEDNLSATVFADLQRANAEAAKFMMNGPNTETSGAELVVAWKPDALNGRLDTKFTAFYANTRADHSFTPPASLGDLGDTLYSLRERLIIEDWQPRWRGTLSADYELSNAFTFGGSVLYFGDYTRSNNPSTPDRLQTQDYDPKMLLNLRANWQATNGLLVSFALNNALDEYPDENELSTFGAGTINGVVETAEPIFKYSNGSPFGYNGASWSVRVKQSF